ncbi:MAG: hypothetical protein P1V21_21775 [Rhizobiaceae bacterium]|nr:hypothetical protein [Rhizobiaceae bacterium]
MANVELDQEEDKPLDPEMEKVRRKMVRLLGISIAIMLVGVMAVLAGVVYKVVKTEDAPSVATNALLVPSQAPLQLTAQLPDGFLVAHVALDGNRVLFHGKGSDGAARVIIFDMATARIIAEIALQGS